MFDSNEHKIVRLFFDRPTKQFQLREISRMLNLGLPSVINHVKILEKENLVKKMKVSVYPSYCANASYRFKLYKRSDMLLRIAESGLIGYIYDKLLPDVIVLFGSASRGEDIESSDIDLFVMAKEGDVDLASFEKKFNRKINLFFEEKLKDVPKEILNNVINGIVLKGYLKVL